MLRVQFFLCPVVILRLRSIAFVVLGDDFKGVANTVLVPITDAGIRFKSHGGFTSMSKLLILGTLRNGWTQHKVQQMLVVYLRLDGFIGV